MRSGAVSPTLSLMGRSLFLTIVVRLVLGRQRRRWNQEKIQKSQTGDLFPSSFHWCTPENGNRVAFPTIRHFLLSELYTCGFCQARSHCLHGRWNRLAAQWVAAADSRDHNGFSGMVSLCFLGGEVAARSYRLYIDFAGYRGV
jgi:hypothetical protein